MARKQIKAELKWHGKEVGEIAMKTMRKNAVRTGMFLEGKVIKSLSIGQPAKRVGNRLVGLNPSKPGKPPHLLHGALRNSITHRVDRGAKHVDVFIGAHTPYARALEFGNPPHLAPRPYLRPAIKNNREKAIKMMVRGLFKRRTIGDRRKLK